MGLDSREESNAQKALNAAIKQAKSLNIPDLRYSLEKIFKAHASIIQSIYDYKPKLDVGEVYIESLSIKLLLASKSIVKLSFGDNLSGVHQYKKIEIIDRSSIFILTRAIVENFLTLEYLFYNDLCKEEQIFRYNLWRISGFKVRQSYGENLRQQYLEKLEREKQEIEYLTDSIQKSKYYSNLNKNNIWKLNKYGFPRILSWDKLIDESQLNSSIVKKAYTLYSNYAHSEFISAIQINENGNHKNSKFNQETLTTSLSLIRMINCVSILQLINKFQFSKEVYNKMNKELKHEIEFWKNIITL